MKRRQYRYTTENYVRWCRQEPILHSFKIHGYNVTVVAKPGEQRWDDDDRILLLLGWNVTVAIWARVECKTYTYEYGTDADTWAMTHRAARMSLRRFVDETGGNRGRDYRRDPLHQHINWKPRYFRIPEDRVIGGYQLTLKQKLRDMLGKGQLGKWPQQAEEWLR